MPIHQLFDKILKRVLQLSSGAVIMLVNELFGKNFPRAGKITYNMTENTDDKLGRTLSDTILTIHAGGDLHRFHIEAEINTRDTNAGTMIIRMFEYGYRDALRHREKSGAGYVLNFPKPIIILLEHNSNSPDSVTMTLNFEGQGTFDFTVPTIKLLDYTVDDLNRQKMVLLLPFYLLKLRRQIENAKKRENSTEAVKQTAEPLKALIADILKAIEETEKGGDINGYDAYVLAGLSKLVYSHLYGNIQEFQEEGVGTMMDDVLLVEYEEEIINAMAKTAVETAAEIAKGLLAEGLPLERIAAVTKLPMSKIHNLRLESAAV
jgi:hypothetical protein